MGRTSTTARSPRPPRDAKAPEAGPAPAADRGARASVDLYEYGAIGDLRSAALVSRHGSIDWACLPEFHSPAVFGRLLDSGSGGFFQVAPRGYQESVQRYLPGTNVLAAYFVLPGGTGLTLTDCMPVAPAFVGGARSAIVRRLESTGGPVDVEVLVEPRFNYGRARTTKPVPEGPGRIAWRSGRDRLSVSGPWSWRWEGRRAVATGTVRPERPAFLVLDWGEPQAPADPAVLLQSTIRFWRDWVRHPEAPLPRGVYAWRDWVERSELLLKLLSNVESGAFVAAPTASLPEWWRGTRNWDYRYAWVRDAAFSAQALFLLGHLREARMYVQWIVGRLEAGGPGGLATMYRSSGEPVDREEELDHWAGYRDSRPVRIGNAAGIQTQLDVYGEVLDAVLELDRVDPEFVGRSWATLSGLVEVAAREWVEPDAGMWESRDPPLHYVHSKVMCWVALDRGEKIATRLGRAGVARRWRTIADRIHGEVMRRGFDQDQHAFVQAFDRPVIDASVLRIPMTGFLAFDDPKVVSTVRAVERTLGNGPFVYRNRTERDPLGPEGAFLLCSFWLVECLARSGATDRAIRIFRRLLRAAGPLRLFPEQWDPISRRPLGNYPQAFTHIGVLRAALALGAGP